jgi:hypothetical protein
MATQTLKVELPAEIFDVQTNVPRGGRGWWVA